MEQEAANSSGNAASAGNSRASYRNALTAILEDSEE